MPTITDKTLLKRITDRQEARKANNRVTYSLRLPAALWASLGAYSERQGTTRTAVIEELIRTIVDDVQDTTRKQR